MANIEPGVSMYFHTLNGKKLCFKQLELNTCRNSETPQGCNFKHDFEDIDFDLFFTLIQDSVPEKLPLFLRDGTEKRALRLTGKMILYLEAEEITIYES